MIPCECLCGTLIPEFDKQGRRRRFVKGHNGRCPSPEAIQKMSESKEGHIVSDATRQLISIGNVGKVRSDKNKKNMSINHADFSGENNPNWQGGLSFEPYCQEWTPWLKDEIKNRDDFKCQNPECLKISKRLACHHIDYDKKNCSIDNLITLCTSCNAKANFNRKYWKEFYSNIINC